MRPAYKQQGVKRKRYGYDVGSKSSKIYNEKQGRSDYAMTLINPFIYLNARVPDLACYPTAVFTVRKTFPFTVKNTNDLNNQGIIHIALATLPTMTYHQNRNGGTPGNFVGGSTTYLGDPNNYTSTKYRASRLVSAMLKVSYAGSDTDTEGLISATYIPPEMTAKVTTGTATNTYGGMDPQQNLSIYGYCYTADTWEMARDYYSGPLKNGAVARFKPVDSSSFDMRPISNNSPAGSGLSFTTPYSFGDIICEIAPGLSTTSTTVQVEISLNFEALLASTMSDANIGISGADPIALAHGLNAAGMSATAFSATQASWARNVDDVLRSIA